MAFVPGQAAWDVVARRVGTCIYCGSTSDLTNEHIVPAALNGNQVLADASCEACRVETSRYETRYLKSIRTARYAAGMGTHRARKKGAPIPLTAPIRLVVDGETREIELPFDRHPNHLLLPVFRRARVLEDPDGDQSLLTEGDPVGIRFGLDPLDVGRQHSASQVTVTQVMRTEDFARLLAKIAYCDAVRVFGLNAFEEVAVLAAICHGANDLGRWVGTLRRDSVPPSDPNVLHVIQPKMVLRGADQPIILHSRVVLFANAPSPTYEVVVGLLSAGTPVPTPFTLDSGQ